MSLSFPVSVEKNINLRNRMEALGLKEIHLEETFVKSGGKGGQNVNKVSTAVVLKHKVLDLHIKCTQYRTQGLNRYKARVLLCEQMERLNEPKKQTEISKHYQKKKKDKLRKTRRKLRDLNLDDKQ
ncbi:peptide chain release factor-like protein [Leptospira sp. 96542]|nr:peptide chain release factor-like protein [Leptospira sp. 96542]